MTHILNVTHTLTLTQTYARALVVVVTIVDMLNVLRSFDVAFFRTNTSVTDDSGREPLSDPPCGLYGSTRASLPSLVDTLAHHLTALCGS